MTTSTSASPPQPTGPQLQDHEVLGRDDVPMKIRGRLLGFASSQTDEHQFHPGDFARPGSRCSACRWFECRIFEVSGEITTDCTCGPNPQDPKKGRLWWLAEAAKLTTVRLTAQETGNSREMPHAFRITEAQMNADGHFATCGVETPRAKYLVLTYGLSDVPGEVDKRRASWTDSPFEIIELLTQRGREDRQAFLPAASARAVAQAANWSEEIRTAYIDRAVV